MHAAHVARHGIGTTRGLLRDALTLFDENAALLSAPSSLLDALHARAWRRLFIGEREAWQHATLVLFGHALLEKLVHPRKEITAHVWVMPGGIESIEDERLQPPTEKAFSVLPVLGVPGWWPPNDDAAFYEDAAVFRAPPAQPGRNPSIDRYRSPES